MKPTGWSFVSVGLIALLDVAAAPPARAEGPADGAPSGVISKSRVRPPQFGLPMATVVATDQGEGIAQGGAPSPAPLTVVWPTLVQFGSNNLVRMTIAGNGNVGIGTAAPAQKLSVAGTIESTIGGFRFPDGTVQTSASVPAWTPTSGSVSFTGGNVGIGTASPGYRLDVAGAGHVSSNLLVGDVNGPLLLVAPASARYLTPAVGVESQGGGVSLGAYGNNPVFLGTNGSERLFVTGAGNVGIGTTRPAQLLTVSGANGAPATSGTMQGGVLRLQYTNGVGLDSGAYSAAPYGTWLQPVDTTNLSGTYPLILNPVGGNVGIGMTNPAERLEVAGNIRLRSAAVPAGVAGLAPTGFGYAPNVYRVLRVGAASGYESVAIGYDPSPNPNATFTGDGREVLFRRGIRFVTPTAANDGYNLMNLVLIDGNVGIGTATPASRLHVVGDITATGAVIAHFQDVAEWVDAAGDLEPGTIVAIDRGASNRVIASDRAYDARVAGAVSEQPGVILGEGGAGRVLVASTGRVRIKVDASYGPIEPGDLLVTSPTPGAAMRSQPLDVGGVPIHRPGTVIGKALEPIDRGTGLILVLLTLQ